MASVNKSYPQLKDNNWMCGLAFLSDITGNLNGLYLVLQGKNKTLTEMAIDVNAFKGKLTFIEAQLRTGDLKQFKMMSAKSTDKNSYEYDKYANKKFLLRNGFDRRFKDI